MSHRPRGSFRSLGFAAGGEASYICVQLMRLRRGLQVELGSWGFGVLFFFPPSSNGMLAIRNIPSSLCFFSPFCLGKIHMTQDKLRNLKCDLKNLFAIPA